MSTQILASMKVQGQKSDGTPINTLTGVNFNSDGSWDFQDASGDVIVYAGNNAQMNKLLEIIFTGTGGFASGTKLFGFA